MPKHGYEETTVEELRTELIALGVPEIEVQEIKGKLNLVNKLLELKKESINMSEEKIAQLTEVLNQTSVLSSLQDDEVLDNTPKEEHEIIPTYGSDEWQKFLLSKLLPNEKEGEYPKCNGLRRLASTYLGDIVSSRPSQVFPATSPEEAGRATVVWEVVINWKLGVPAYLDLNGINDFRRVFADVADCWVGNTPATYAVHPASTAATRAEGRAWRKALMLNVVTAEEITNGNNADAVVEKSISNMLGTKTTEWSEGDKITASQKNFITKKCDAMSIELEKFINKRHYVSGEEKTYSSIEDVSRGVAAAMIEELNRYQNESSDPSENRKIPSQILK